MRLLTTGVLIVIFCLSIKAQPHLEVYPSELEFTDIFHRLQNAYFINSGNQPLSIDSIAYNSNFYFVRFNVNWRYPFVIQPNDTVKMDCILAGYLNYTSSDTLDTLLIYNNGISPQELLNVKIDYYNSEHYHGILQGNISSDGSPVQNADVYFLYGGNFVIAQAKSDIYGNYVAQLPVGNYSVAAGRDSFYISFYDQRSDPLSATQVFVDTNGTTTVDFNLERKAVTQYSVSGKIYDSVSNYSLNKGIVIVRSGTHTPYKVKPNNNIPGITRTYAAFVNADGVYNIDDIIDAGYYYIQSFSDYFVPTYYDSLGQYPSFWQTADTIYIGSHLIGLNINMPRDSSLGGGVISGTVQVTGTRDSILTGAIVYARSVDNNLITYAFSQNDGSFRENFLPYGSYYLVAQKIGYKDAVSDKIIIDSSTTNVGDIHLLFIPPNSVRDPKIIPDKIELYQNYPNPFNPSTTIEFNLPVGTNVTLKIINILGQTVSVLHDGFLSAGRYKMQFDAKGLSSGVYFVSLISNTTSLVRKIILLK